MSTHNIGFYEDLTKVSFEYYQISNTHLISSAGPARVMTFRSRVESLSKQLKER